MEDSQLLRGVLEGCVLSVIAKGETYGYLILDELEKCGFENLFEGTLYPVIARLEKRGYVSCRREKSPFGPIRKYYKITKDGESALSEFWDNYDRISNSVQRVRVLKEEK